MPKVKETHKIIGEWVSTERLISEEESDWDVEKINPARSRTSPECGDW